MHTLGQDAAELDRVQLHLRAACPGGEATTRGAGQCECERFAVSTGPFGDEVGDNAPVVGSVGVEGCAGSVVVNRRDYARETRWTFLHHGPRRECEPLPASLIDRVPPAASVVA